MSKQYTLLFLISCLTFLSLPIDRPLNGFYLAVMVLFAGGVTLKAWDAFTLRPRMESKL